MKLWWVLILFLLLAHNAYSSKTTTSARFQSQTNFEHLSIDSIDKLNARANKTYLANPNYSRKLAGYALIASKVIGYKKGMGQSFLNIGITYWSQSYYPVSLLYIDTALRYFTPADNILRSESFCYMGRIYADMKDYKSAAVFLEKARLAAENDKGKLLNVVVDMSYLYYKTDRFDSAFKAINEAMQLCRAMHDTGTEAVLYSRLASMYFVRQQYNKTLGYCDTAIRLSYIVNNKRLRAASFAERSAILLSQNNTNGALDYGRQALAMSDSLGIMDIKTKAYRAIIAVYDTLHNDKQLLHYEREFNEFLKQRNILDKQSSSQLMRDYFELNAKLQDISQIKEAAKQNELHIKAQRQVIMILALSLILVFAALYIVYFYYRQKVILGKKLHQEHVAVLAQSQVIKIQAQDLEELNSFKSKLLAIIGHDLRSPINNLRNVTDMFEDGSFSPEEVHALMKSINPMVKSAEITLSNLLIWADGQIRGKKHTQATTVNLLKIVNEAKEIWISAVAKKMLHIQCEVKPGDLALADENHIKVIFSNLISNAIKFTENKGTITLDVNTRNDHKLEISIADTGVGMTTEEAEKVLLANTHFSKHGTQGETGTGIGLLLCRELIELNGGKLWLTSTPGKGTTFYFTLPAATTL